MKHSKEPSPRSARRKQTATDTPWRTRTQSGFPHRPDLSAPDESKNERRDRLARWRASVIDFAREVLGVERFDEQQLSVLSAVPGARFVTVKSGHSCGKTFLAACVAVWLWFTEFPAVVITTAPTARQVRHILWREIRKLFRRVKDRFPTLAEPKEQFVKYNPKADDWEGAPENDAEDQEPVFLGFTSRDDADRFQGFHGRRVLVVVDEASGISPDIWTAIKGVTTGAEDRIVMIGNPTFDPAGEFYRAFTAGAQEYARFTLDSELSSWCSREWIEARKREWGEESPLYRARVKGEFPREASDTLIPLAWIEAAVRRYEETPAGPERSLGVDVARFGSDSTCDALLAGARLARLNVAQGQDLMRTAGDVARAIQSGEVPAGAVRIDDTGLGGGVTDRLRELGYDVIAVNAGEKSSDERFVNMRTQAAWALRERFREGQIAIPDDPLLLRELVAPRIGLTSAGVMKLEPKEETKKRLGYSPDRFDALALAALSQAELGAIPSHGGASVAPIEGREEPLSMRRDARVSQESYRDRLRVRDFGRAR